MNLGRLATLTILSLLIHKDETYPADIDLLPAPLAIFHNCQCISLILLLLNLFLIILFFLMLLRTEFFSTVFLDCSLVIYN